MHYLKQLYNNNSIFRFWTSYLLVLIVPLLLVFGGFQYVFYVVEQDARQTNVTMLEHSINLFDSDLSSLETMARQASQNLKVMEFSSIDTLNGDTALLAKKAMNEFSSLVSYHGIYALDQSYIYFLKSNYVMYDATLYRPDIFEKYVTEWGMDIDAWYEMCSNQNGRATEYVPTNKNSLQYLVPLSDTLWGENLGVLVFHLDSQKLKSFFDFSKKIENYSIFIWNEKKQEILWSDDNLNYTSVIKQTNADTNLSKELDHDSTICVNSEKTGWKYLLIVPEKEVTKELRVVKVVIFLLLALAIIAGELISLYLSIREGKPMNEIFTHLGQKEGNPRNSVKLGELVGDIVNRNQEYCEELEKDKPLLQKAFFHDLIKAEMVNTTEMRYMAEKAGISIDECNFSLVALRFFANNDYYEIDEQTIEDARVMMQVVNSYIEDIMKKQIWFYKKDYLTNFIFFFGKEDAAELKPVLEQVYHWIFTTYSVETRWGISSCSNDLLNVWRVCEEAITALDNCDTYNHIVQYHSKLDNKGEYYFPDIAKECIKNCIQYGDIKRLINVLNIIKKENYDNRNLNRSRFMKLNTNIVTLLSEYCDSNTELHGKLLQLNQIVIEYDEDMQEKYFNFLQDICSFLTQETTNKKRAQRDQLIDRIRSYINENYMDSGLGLAKVSTEFGISEGYVSSIFKEQDGVNFADYVEKLRIERACQLLKDDNYTINDISGRVGYNSVQSFRRAFKRVTNIKPTEFRKE